MSAVLEVLGWSLLHSIWQGALVAGGLWLVLRLAAPGAARARYVAGLMALATLLALPVLNYRATMELWSGHRSWVLATADEIVRTDLATRGRTEVGTVRGELRRRQALEWPVAPLPASPAARDAARLLALLWLGAAALLAIRLAGEQRRALGLGEGGLPDEAWRTAAARVGARLGLRRTVRVRVSDRVDVPTLVGWRWPVVLVPPGATGLPEAQRDAVLAHELAHIRRGDYLANLLQVTVEALLFYSPAAWFVSARIREERECCCDVAAVEAMGGAPARYVQALLALETGRPGPRPVLALTGGPLVRRIRRIHGQARRPERRTPAAALLAFAACLAAAVATCTPALAAERSAAVLIAADIDDVRLVGIRAAPAAAPPSPASCSGTVGTARA